MPQFSQLGLAGKDGKMNSHAELDRQQGKRRRKWSERRQEAARRRLGCGLPLASASCCSHDW